VIEANYMGAVERKHLRWNEAVDVVLKHGKRSDGNDMLQLTNVFDVARLYGGTVKDEFVCMLGYAVGSVRGLIRPFSEGWYLLSPKGERERERRFPTLNSDNQEPPV
jgi:hypothetical protein